MMRVPLHITYDDGSGVDVDATAPDLIAFERKFDKPFSIFANEMRLEYLLWLAWSTCRRKNNLADEFDPWCEKIDTVVVGDVSDPVPLESPAPTGS